MPVIGCDQNTCFHIPLFLTSNCFVLSVVCNGNLFVSHLCSLSDSISKQLVVTGFRSHTLKLKECNLYYAGSEETPIRFFSLEKLNIFGYICFIAIFLGLCYITHIFFLINQHCEC